MGGEIGEVTKVKSGEIEGKLVSFLTNDKLPLEGFISRSKAHNKKLIISVHGMTGDFFSYPLMWTLAKELIGTNYDLFLANNRGSGIKTKFYLKDGRRILGTAYEKFEDCILDIDAAVNKAKKLGYKEIILAGHSTGCQKITYYQAKKQNKIVKGIILLSPASDYEIALERFGKKLLQIVAKMKKLIAKGRGNLVIPKYTGDYTINRFVSFADPTRAEAETFNYGGELKLFSKIRTPILAVFGTKEKHTAGRKVTQMLQILRIKSNSVIIATAEILGGDHSFVGKEKETCLAVKEFLKLLE